MALTDPIFSLRLDPKSSNVASIDLIEQRDIGREMKIPVLLSQGNSFDLDLSPVGSVYRLIFIPDFEDRDPVPTKINLKIFKLPSPEKEITIEFLNLFVWDIPVEWVSSIKQVSLSTDSEEEYELDVRVWGV